MIEHSGAISESAATQAPDRFEVEVRRCYYLRLEEAVRVTDGVSPLRFNVPALARWIAMLRTFGGGWVAIRPLFSDEQIVVETKKGLQAVLGRLVPPPEENMQWVLDIPERYHTRLLSGFAEGRGDSSLFARVHFTAPATPNQNAAYPSAQLRYCYYLHLDQAENMLTKEHEPILKVPAKARWVLVRRYLRDDWAQVYKLTSDDVTENGLEKPFHVHLGKVVPKSPEDSWAQCILERYPERLLREAEHDHKRTKKVFDLETTRSLFKKIDAASPEHWVPVGAKRIK